MVERTRMLHISPPDVAWLVIMKGGRRGRDFRMEQVTNIGRDAMRNDVILDDDAVSAEHARIKLERKRFVLYDLASSNGTFVNKEKIEKRALDDGDEITIGETTFVFKVAKSK